MIKKSTLEFLKSLKKNNNRDWFNKHKEDYRAALADFEEFIGDLILAVSAFDKAVIAVQPKEAIWRIYRDVRFAKDKSPYKTYFGAVIGPGGRKGTDAMYYFHLEPGNSSLAGGLYRPPSSELSKVRQAIDKNGDKVKSIISDTSFKKLFGKIVGEQLKTAPRGYSVDHPYIDLLRHKDLLVTHKLSDKQVLSSQLTRATVKNFRVIKPFNDWLNRARGRQR